MYRKQCIMDIQKLLADILAKVQRRFEHAKEECKGDRMFSSWY